MSAVFKGDYADALKIQDRLTPLHDAIFKEPGLAGAKHGLALLGRGTEEVRLPLMKVTPPTGQGDPRRHGARRADQQLATDRKMLCRRWHNQGGVGNA